LFEVKEFNKNHPPQKSRLCPDLPINSFKAKEIFTKRKVVVFPIKLAYVKTFKIKFFVASGAPRRSLPHMSHINNQVYAPELRFLFDRFCV